VQVLSRCQLGVASILWLPRPGAYTLTVACKATFQLAPDLSPLAAEQDPVTESDVFWDDDESKSLDRTTDLVPFKHHPEVLLVGHAYAPQGAPVSSLVARLTIAEVDKAIEVTGDRHFKLDGSLSYPARFSRMPLRWERAAGGAETSNPAGVVMGEEARPDAWGRVAVPNLVGVGRLVSDRQDIVSPACFAPMAATWLPRVTHLHRHAAGWAPHAWQARPLPGDFNAAYFNAAPADQHLHELTGEERITLENLHPTYPLLTTRLAKVAPRALVDWGTGSTYEIPLACDTLLIDTDRGVATLTFRGHIALDFPERSGWIIVTDGGGNAGVKDMPAWLEGVSSVHETVAGLEQPAQPALPFGGDRGSGAGALDDVGDADDFDDEDTFASDRGEPAPPPEVPKGPRLGAFRLGAASERPAAGQVPLPRASPPPSPPPPPPAALTSSRPVVPAGSLPAPRLPGVPVPAGAAPAPRLPGVPVPAGAAPAPSPPTFGFRRPITLSGAEPTASGATVMPFVAQPGEAAARAPSEPFARAATMPFMAGPSGRAPSDPLARSGGMPFLAQSGEAARPPSDPLARSGGMPFLAPSGEAARAPSDPLARSGGMPFLGSTGAPSTPSPGMTIGERVAQTRGIPVDGPLGIVPESTQDVALSDTPPAPPLRLGPLATPEMVAEDLGVPVAAPAEAAPGAAVAAEPEPPSPPPPPKLPIEEYPLERCARIAASIARTRARLAEILEQHALDEERWDALRTHWASAIKSENERGKTALLRAYDAAYVAQLEDERGPIAVDEYAKLVVASERGRAEPALAELGLPDSAMLRIHRVWMQRTIKDPEMRTQVRRAVEIESDA